MVYGFLVILVVMIFAQHWVLRPLSKIKASLALGKIEPVNYLLKDDAEFWQIARLVRQSFSDQNKLTTSLDERARLGRDLHYGVIQTLYATGMTMTSIRRHIRQKPEIADDCKGFSPDEASSSSLGIRNFYERAQELHATLDIDSRPNNGARIIFLLPQLSKL